MTDINAETVAALLEKITQGVWDYDSDVERVTSTEIHNGEVLTWTVVESPRLAVGMTDLLRDDTGRFIAAAPDIARAYLELSKENEWLENEIVEMLAGEDI